VFSRVRIRAGLTGAATLLLVAGCNRPADVPITPSSTGGSSGSTAQSSLSPVPRIFDVTALEAGVRRVLTQSYQLTGVGEVRCPSGQAVQAGISFDCSIELNGTTKTVTLTVENSAGTYRVSQPK
jgi:Domain of unknown function (DUF4333)